MVAMSSFSTTSRRKYVGCLNLSAEPSQALKDRNNGNIQKHVAQTFLMRQYLPIVSHFNPKGG
jgi:hypothetical protein